MVLSINTNPTDSIGICICDNRIIFLLTAEEKSLKLKKYTDKIHHICKYFFLTLKVGG